VLEANEESRTMQTANTWIIEGWTNDSYLRLVSSFLGTLQYSLDLNIWERLCSPSIQTKQLTQTKNSNQTRD